MPFMTAMRSSHWSMPPSLSRSLVALLFRTFGLPSVAKLMTCLAFSKFGDFLSSFHPKYNPCAIGVSALPFGIMRIWLVIES